MKEQIRSKIKFLIFVETLKLVDYYFYLRISCNKNSIQGVSFENYDFGFSFF